MNKKMFAFSQLIYVKLTQVGFGAKALTLLLVVLILSGSLAQGYTDYRQRSPRMFSQRVTFSDNRLLYGFLDDFTRAVELHDWDLLLTYFYEDTYLIQTQEFGFSDPEFIATAIGLQETQIGDWFDIDVESEEVFETQSVNIEEEEERVSYKFLDKIDTITLEQRINSGIGAAEIRGVVTLIDGGKYGITLFLRRSPTGRYEVVSPVG